MNWHASRLSAPSSMLRKANDLLAAERELEIQQARALAALEEAKADTAMEAALAAIYAANQGLLNFKIAELNAAALERTDKIIFTPEGSTPTLVLPGPGIVPTVDTTPETASTSTGPNPTVKSVDKVI